jgi:CelD/BcsL family acetyltransferase involved in cellulose biosynthesis
MSRDPTCTIVGDAAGIAALRSHWWELWRRVRATPFQAPAWLVPWWHAFAPGNPLVIAARRVGRLVGLAPFYLEHGARRRLLPIGISVSDYHDILVQDGDAAAIREAIMACVADHHAEWRVWELPELPPRSQALSLPVPPGCIEVVEQASACPVLALPADAGAFVQRLPYRKRRWVRMAQNRARRRGELACVAAADARHARDILETLFRLHGACWKQRGEAGVLANARVRAFHREAPRRMLQAGLLRMFELRIAGAAAAVYYGFHHRDCAYGYLTGFDPSYAFESRRHLAGACDRKCDLRGRPRVPLPARARTLQIWMGRRRSVEYQARVSAPRSPHGSPCASLVIAAASSVRFPTSCGARFAAARRVTCRSMSP